MWSFSDFQYSFRSSRSTADLLIVVSDRITRAFNRSGATWAVALDISKAFDRVWHAGLLQKLKSYGISGQILGHISSFLSNSRLRVVLDGKSSQEYPVNAWVPQGSTLGHTFFLLFSYYFPLFHFSSIQGSCVQNCWTDPRLTHPFEVYQISIRNFWGLSGKKYCLLVMTLQPLVSWIPKFFSNYWECFYVYV